MRPHRFVPASLQNPDHAMVYSTGTVQYWPLSTAIRCPPPPMPTKQTRLWSDLSYVCEAQAQANSDLMLSMSGCHPRIVHSGLAQPSVRTASSYLIFASRGAHPHLQDSISTQDPSEHLTRQHSTGERKPAGHQRRIGSVAVGRGVTCT